MARAARKTPTKRRVEPYAQGDLDCMCAIYTIINAVRALCPEMTIGASSRIISSSDSVFERAHKRCPVPDHHRNEPHAASEAADGSPVLRREAVQGRS